MTLEGRRAKEKGEAVRGLPSSVRPWHQPAPPHSTNSANPLTLEIVDFQSHGELRTGLTKRWALSAAVSSLFLNIAASAGNAQRPNACADGLRLSVS